MKNKLLLALTVIAFSVPSANADVIINFSDVGSDLFFSWSGSLDASAGDGFDPIGGPTYATIGIQNSGNSPTFYSAPQSHPPYVSGLTFTGTNNPGLFATNAPAWTSFMPGSFGTGLPFLFRVNNALHGPTSVNVWADWGPANTLFDGTLTIANESIASMGMVDGYTLETSGGNIIFQSASVPAPASILLLGLGLLGLGIARKRKTA